jgi:nicotinate-nucleotide adenylyltransferase
VETLRGIHAREPGVELTLLLGADAAAELEAWREAPEIPRLATVVVFARPGVAVPASRLIARTVRVPAIEISATEIRRRAREGRSLRYWVPDPVAEYVTRHRLYLDPA